jgi:hypothetical protein
MLPQENPPLRKPYYDTTASTCYDMGIGSYTPMPETESLPSASSPAETMEGFSRGSCHLASAHCSTLERDGRSPCSACALLSISWNGIMCCAICGERLDASHHSVLPTTDGQQVHLVCAEREAYRAARRRTVRAMVTVLLLAGLLVIAVLVKPGALWISALALLLALIHGRLNRRWWHYTVQSVRLWWRMRG